MLVARTYFSVVPVLRITLIRTLALPVLPEPVRGLLFLCECRGHWTSKGPCDENEAEHEALEFSVRELTLEDRARKRWHPELRGVLVTEAARGGLFQEPATAVVEMAR